MSDKLQDVALEGLALGYIYRKPEILNEYLELISPEYDFSDNNLRFLYNLLSTTFLSHDVLNETSINIQISKMNDESKNLFQKLGGVKIYNRLSKISEVNEEFKIIYSKLKTYNVLRNLHNRGFAVQDNIEKLKDLNVDQILKVYESQLLKVASFIKGINEGERIGDDIIEFYNELKKTPDEGISIPFDILSYLIRGLRLCTIGGIGLNSGFGKSRTIVRILTHTSIINQTPICVIANEQTASEWKSMLLTSVANNIIAPPYNVSINEDEITRGQCTGVKDKILLESAEYIRDRSKIYFYETNVFDLNALRMIIRTHQLRYNINHFIIDTFKPYRSQFSSGMAEWQQYTYTTEQLKDFARQLKINITFTFQLVDTVLQTGELNSNSISSGKNIAHHMDYIILGKQLTYSERQKYKIKIHMPNNPFNGQFQDFDIHSDYYVYKVIKNRAGMSNVSIVVKVDRGKLLFSEVGYLSMGG